MKAIFTLVLCLTPMTAAYTAGLVGTEVCAGCHLDEHRLWQGSHHELAMQPADSDSVLGDFDKASYTNNGQTTRFLRDDDSFIIRTTGEDGKLQNFTVQYVLGAFPLQQYLLPLSRGRLQAFDIAWDARPQEEGGQRWFHLNSDISGPDDPMHWTGPFMNWNSRCAECHSTAVEKRYNSANREFATRFAAPNVGCEACHGPGAKHLQYVQDGRLSDTPNGGFPVALKASGEWAFRALSTIAERPPASEPSDQVDACGRCHARRDALDQGPAPHGRPLVDTHLPALPSPPLYHIDGQIRDEVFVYGSFLQSAMHQAGVVCSDCHEPHSLKLRTEGNELCAQCHQATVYDRREHHRHAETSAGAECVNCHMPATTYMQIDPRRDHSIRIPRPDLSVILDTPNACNQCHQDRSADWALRATRDWGLTSTESDPQTAVLLQQLTVGNRSANQLLAEFASQPDASPIMRAVVLEALGKADNRPLPGVAELLRSPEPLVRIGAVRSLVNAPLDQRYSLLRALIMDPITSVRAAVAEALAPVTITNIPDNDRRALESLFNEYLSIQQANAERPESQLQTGIFLLNRGDLSGAERAYREALHLNPLFVTARLNLADLLRQTRRDGESRQQLQAALAAAPANPDVLHALGLLEIRAGNRSEAMRLLRQAAALEQDSVSYRYIYAIALYDYGLPQQALDQLEDAVRIAPDNARLRITMAEYYSQLGELDKALKHAQHLLTLEPENENYRRLYRQLSN